jgi:putative membrane protein
MKAIPLAAIGWGGGLAIVWGLMGVAFWILLIVLIVVLVQRMRTAARASGGPAVRLLEERYARGEITREEFLERRTVLGGGPPASRATTRDSVHAAAVPPTLASALRKEERSRVPAGSRDSSKAVTCTADGGVTALRRKRSLPTDWPAMAGDRGG